MCRIKCTVVLLYFVSTHLCALLVKVLGGQKRRIFFYKIVGINVSRVYYLTIYICIYICVCVCVCVYVSVRV